jgi:hypothetical protein
MNKKKYIFRIFINLQHIKHDENSEGLYVLCKIYKILEAQMNIVLFSLQQ